MISRRSFIQKSIAMTGSLTLGSRFLFGQQHSRIIMTVNGPTDPARIGNTLIHEHILVDFIGAAKSNPSRWNKEHVIQRILPLLNELKAAGGNTMVECTPNHLGRDVVILKELSRRTGINIVTNTGYYGGSDNKFLPQLVFSESEEQLSARWTKEWKEGIDGTDVKPGFIKISVNDQTLSDVSRKLIRAAALTHRETGLTIASHTGPYTPAGEQLEILKSMNVHPSAFIWVHAQAEKDWSHYAAVARDGGWVSLDGLSESNITEYQEMLKFMKSEKCLHRTLISHDAGWYDPEKENGGEIRGYTTLFKKLIPAIRNKILRDEEINQLLVKNPQEVFWIRPRVG